jgi:hypothetical protein
MCSCKLHFCVLHLDRVIVEAANIARARPAKWRVASYIYISDGLQSARARELLVNIGSASLQFYKAPSLFVRKAVTSYASQVY